MRRDFLFLDPLERYADVGLLLLRLVTGAFLVHGVIDNIADGERMQEFASFLGANGFPVPGLLAPLSVYLQFLCGALLILGLFARWTALIVAVHFIVAVVMVHWSQDFRGWWPALVLVFIGLHIGFSGAGRLSLDRYLLNRRLA